MQEVKISGVIITLNEEKNIERCINSLKEVCDEIVVVDSFSTDDTKEICLQHGVNFIEHEFEGHIEQKNYALDQAEHDIVLSLDADESLDELLMLEIAKVKENFTADAYSFNRLTNYAGFWVRHCDWYPDVKVRLFNKTKGRWGGLNPHDIVQMQEGSKVVHIKGDLLHYSYDSISDHVNQTNKFTTIAAVAAFEKGVRSNNFKIISRPFLKFLKDYFLRMGFLDGYYGLIICYINALSAFLKYSKLKEIQEGKAI